jgi:hypothetical protein
MYFQVDSRPENLAIYGQKPVKDSALRTAAEITRFHDWANSMKAYPLSELAKNINGGGFPYSLCYGLSKELNEEIDKL